MSADHEGQTNQLPEIDRLIHEPSRYNIMALLFVVERADFLFVKNQTGLTPGNLSSHLSKLENAGYVGIEKKFVGKTPRTMLSLTPEGRQAFEIYRAVMKHVFSSPVPEPEADPDSDTSE